MRLLDELPSAVAEQKKDNLGPIILRELAYALLKNLSCRQLIELARTIPEETLAKKG